MLVMTLKAKSAAPGQFNKLIVEANETATDLLHGPANHERVLVVYDKLSANIYCEGGRQKRPS